MAKRRIIIGDVHGHHDGMMSLLEHLSAGAADEVYFLGDLIDRGPKSAEVVEFVKNSPYQCLMGNHEQLMMNALPLKGQNPQGWQAWLYSGGHATITSYQESQIIPREHLEWMRSLSTHLDLGDIWLVHAGIHPHLPLAQQTATEFCWIRGEFHHIPRPYFTNKLIIIGHTITFTFDGVDPGTLVQGPGWLGIDTGVYHAKSGWLTGLDITERKVYQVNVFTHEFRTLPLDEAMSRLKPPSLLSRFRYARS